MEALKEIGFNLTNFVLYFINFGLVLFLLTKLLYKPIIKMLEEQEDKERKANENFRLAEEAVSQSRESYENMINSAKQEAKEIISSQKSKLDEIFKKAEVDAQAEKEKILKEAREEAKDEVLKMIAGSSKELVKDFAKILVAQSANATPNSTIEDLTLKSLEQAEKDLIKSLKG
ncbi:MAG: hypothetical protein Fur0024_3690 [Patescibacteria group bacterium]